MGVKPVLLPVPPASSSVRCSPPLRCVSRPLTPPVAPPPAAPEAPHISSVDYAHGVVFVRWTYGELFVDLSHSRMLHWQVVAVGKKGPERSFSVDVSSSGTPEQGSSNEGPTEPFCLWTGDPKRDAGQPPASSGGHLQSDGDGVHRARQEHVGAQYHQAG